MQNKEIDYSKTIIYKIVCKDKTITDCYIGHTTSFTKRKNQHKSCCNNEKNKEYNNIKYQYIRNNGGWNNWDMIEIEKYSCQNKDEAKERERHFIELFKSKLNIFIPTRTSKEYEKDNAEKLN